MKSNRRWVFAFWSYLGLIVTISVSAYLKILPTKLKDIPFYDTAGHFILIGLAAYLSHLALRKRTITCLSILIPLAPLLVSIFTLADELLQLLSPNRTFSFVDLAADLCGIVFFTWLAERQNLNKSSTVSTK